MTAIRIGYSLAESKPGFRAATTTVTDSDLRYSLFPGDVAFVVGECDFSANWGWVPILDFAYGLLWILDDLDESETRHFEFTESEAIIEFRLTDGIVHISATYAPYAATCRLSELIAEARAFARKVVEDIRMLSPQVAASPAFIALTNQMLRG